MPFTLTRQQFYDVLWSAPMTKLRPTLGLSDVMIGRIARGSNIPVPGLGYWRKVETGKSVEKVQLPVADVLSQPKFSFEGFLTPEVTAMFSGEPGVGPEADGDPDQEEDLEMLGVRLRERLGEVAIPKRDKDFHPGIKKMQVRDLKRSGWDGPTYTSPVGKRALVLANAMLLAVERMGARPTTSTDYSEFQFHLGLKWVPSMKVHILQGGKLEIGPADLRASDGIGHKTYQDSEKFPLEAQIANIIVSYAVQGERAWREWRDRNAEHERREAQRKAEQRDREAREAEAVRVKELEDQRRALIATAIAEASRWRDAELLRQYAGAFLAARGDDHREHHSWLLSVADQIDPLFSPGSE